MNARRMAVAVTILVFAAACQRHETSIAGSYGSGVVSGQVAMAATVANSSPSGVQVSVQGTGMSMILGDDGRFTFSGVPENAVLHFTRGADGIDAVAGVSAASMAIELSSKTATTSGRRRAAPVAPLLQFEGTVKSVTADTLVVTTSFKTDVTVTLTTDTVIRKGQTAVVATDLKPGDRVHVKSTFKDNVYTATEVIVQTGEDDGDNSTEPQTATGNGIVKSIGTNSLVVTRANGDEVNVNVDGSTIIRRYGQIITFAGINVGDKVESVGSVVDSHTILARQIEVQDAPGTHGTVSVEGAVKSVGSSSLVITTGSGDVTVTTDSNTKIRKQGKSISLSDVHPGDGASVQGSRVDASTVLAQTIEVHSSGH